MVTVGSIIVGGANDNVGYYLETSRAALGLVSSLLPECLMLHTLAYDFLGHQHRAIDTLNLAINAAAQVIIAHVYQDQFRIDSGLTLIPISMLSRTDGPR